MGVGSGAGVYQAARTRMQAGQQSLLNLGMVLKQLCLQTHLPSSSSSLLLYWSPLLLDFSEPLPLLVQALEQYPYKECTCCPTIVPVPVAPGCILIENHLRPGVHLIGKCKGDPHSSSASDRQMWSYKCLAFLPQVGTSLHCQSHCRACPWKVLSLIIELS
jgi:hypothetical protein